MSTFVFHVGITKSGTTTLQRSVFTHHPDVFYLGKYKGLGNTTKKGTRNEDVFSVLEPVLWRNLREPVDLEATRSAYEERIAPMIESGQTIIASWESFANLPPAKFSERLRRVQTVVGDIKVLFTLRNPVNWLPSQYLEGLQNNYFKNSRDRLFHGRPYLDFDTWLNMRAEENNNQGLGGFLRYNHNIRHCVEELGRENTGVYPLEYLAKDPDQYYLELSEFLSIDVSTTKELSRGTHHNPRLLAVDVEFMRLIAADPEKLAVWQAQSVAERHRAFQAMRDGYGDEENLASARIEMPYESRALVEEATAEGHRWLSAQFGCSLNDYGYPC